MLIGRRRHEERGRLIDIHLLAYFTSCSLSNISTRLGGGGYGNPLACLFRFMITLNIDLPVTVRPIFKPWNRTFIPLPLFCRVDVVKFGADAIDAVISHTAVATADTIGLCDFTILTVSASFHAWQHLSRTLLMVVRTTDYSQYRT